MEILVFNDNDLTKQGILRKNNNSLNFNETEFKQYVKVNNLTLSKGYIDLIGFVSNETINKKFRCYYNNIIIGVTGIINKIKEE